MLSVSVQLLRRATESATVSHSSGDRRHGADGDAGGEPEACSTSGGRRSRSRPRAARPVLLPDQHDGERWAFTAAAPRRPATSDGGALADGAYVLLAVYVRDAAGNQAPRSASNFSIDATAPTAALGLVEPEPVQPAAADVRVHPRGYDTVLPPDQRRTTGVHGVHLGDQPPAGEQPRRRRVVLSVHVAGGTGNQSATVSRG
ncbi:MAG: hypothetical protein HS111_03150 [Kofleriaceae bacterium]|nr:hypothetical protein [Kofleriaceae bacterium]